MSRALVRRIEGLALQRRTRKYMAFALLGIVNFPVIRFWYGTRLRHLIEQTAPGRAWIHLACGKRPFVGWINIDFVPYSPGPDILLDLCKPLPLKDNTVDLMYSEDFIEHVDLEQGRRILREWYRVLRPGGMLRLLTPNLRALATDYVNRCSDLLEWYGHLYGPASFAEVLNHGMRAWGHQFLYDDELLTHELQTIGFSPQLLIHNQSNNPFLRALDRPDLQETKYRMYFDCLKL